ncbi:hypothetical protein [Limimaricola sp. AA108-03]|jgi:hypothetical protein|uniref:hypothetical protein n=1 Tax=Limimaricola sp. AA108-03 TaxID=3425945 RepID=UPI003D785940
MTIRKKRIRNIEQHLVEIEHGADLRLAVELSPSQKEKLHRLGFPEHPISGDTVLPTALGPVSRLNADGKWIACRDQEKEDRYIRTVRWRWKTWDGQEHEEFRDIYRACYPRIFENPAGIELNYVEVNGVAYATTSPFKNMPENHDTIRHAVNLLLELFGECDILTVDLGRFDRLQVRRLSWRMLPPGQYPWSRMKSHLDETLKRCSDSTRSVILDRQKTILDHGPDEQFVGTGGFSDYIAYVFVDRGIVVLESIRKGNAIYVFGKGWSGFSKLSKAEILDQNLHLARIVHTEGWKERLAGLLNTRAAA